MNPWALRRLVLENDDRVFALEDVLPLAEAHGLAVAFDWHHHRCNPGGATDGDELVELLLRAFSGWRDRPPKVHVSSPRSSKQPRAHADYVDPSFIEPFLAVLARLPVSEVDMMVEAKQKDLAALRLREQLRWYENVLP
ncbi:MAG TPA: hypothetical protein VIL95_05355 [Bacillota bacterium]